MLNPIYYHTDDVEERNMALALNDLFTAMAENGIGEDPLDLICRCLVRRVEEVQFAFYCYDGEEIGKFPVVSEGTELFMPPPDVQRKIVARLRQATHRGEVAVIPPEKWLPMLTPSQRRQWRPHLCVAADIIVEGHPIAVMAVYLKPDFQLADRQRGWFSLFRNAASALLTQRAIFRRAKLSAHDDMFAHDRALDAWVNAGLGDRRIKALVGIRGSGKTAMLNAVRSRVLASGVSVSRVCTIDFDDSHTRRFRSAADLLGYLDSFSVTKKDGGYLFLNEVGMVNWHGDLLRRLQGCRNWNVWISTSILHVIEPFAEERGKSALSVFHTWANPNVPRPIDILEKIWFKIFVRDVGAGFEHPDIRAKEALAEYFSDHLGESCSLREASKELAESGSKLSSVSIRSFRQALVDARLIEFSPIYDLFERQVVTSLSGRVFYTDLELREWRFTGASKGETRRLALNRLYLELRRKHQVVYTPRDSDADFLTFDAKGNHVLWRLPPSSPPPTIR